MGGGVKHVERSCIFVSRSLFGCVLREGCVDGGSSEPRRPLLGPRIFYDRGASSHRRGLLGLSSELLSLSFYT
eukprot:3392503-Pyramimonas_sp.AAC.1